MEEKLNPWSRYKQNLGETRPWDLFNSKTPRLTPEFAEERFNICVGCEHFIKMTAQCKKCGCFMAVKTKLAASACPVGKWSPMLPAN